jgi:hypothetical protein
MVGLGLVVAGCEALEKRLRWGRSEPLEKTTVRHVAPVDGQGHALPGFTVVKRRSGRCPPISDYSTGPIYKCVFGRFLADPCWRLTAPRQVSALCMRAPWSREVVRVDVKRLTPGSSVRKNRDWPWAIELAGGERCPGRTGAGDLFNGRPIDYLCGGRPSLGVLRGLDQEGRLWHADTAWQVDGRYVAGRTVPIRTAWYVGARGR